MSQLPMDDLTDLLDARKPVGTPFQSVLTQEMVDAGASKIKVMLAEGSLDYEKIATFVYMEMEQTLLNQLPKGRPISDARLYDPYADAVLRPCLNSNGKIS
jgi:hypothetical protein